MADANVTPAKLASHIAMGTFTPTGTGNKAVTGVGFKPKLVRFVSLNANQGTVAAFSMGAMTDTQQYVAGIGHTTSNAQRMSSKAACYGEVSSASLAWYTLANRVSLDSDGFTINFSIFNTGPAEVLWEAFA